MPIFEKIQVGYSDFPELTVCSNASRLRLVGGERPFEENTRAIVNSEHGRGCIDIRLAGRQLFITFNPEESPDSLPERAPDKEILRAASKYLKAKGLNPNEIEIVLEVKLLPGLPRGDWPKNL